MLKQKMLSSFQIPEIQSSHGVLILERKYVLQLRDTKPTIAAPGQWSLFGGAKEIDETPLQAVKREIFEELLIEPSKYSYLWFTDYFADFEGEIIRTWFFVSDVTLVWPHHQLIEGHAVRTFRFEQIADLKMPQVMRLTIGRYHQHVKRD